MKALLRRVKNVVNDRITRVLFYDQTLKKGYASLAPFSKLFILRRALVTAVAFPLSLVCWVFLLVLNLFTPVRLYRFERPNRPGFASVYIAQLEPLCRELQANGNKGFLVFIDASETTNLELLKLYASHFNLYLDDQSKFTRTVFSLIPKLGFINAYAEFATYSINWELPAAIDLNPTSSNSSASTLVAPVAIGTGAWTAAGSTITGAVPSDALGIGRARQSTIENWAKRRRAALQTDPQGNSNG